MALPQARDSEWSLQHGFGPIAQCRSAGLGPYFHLSDFLPTHLPDGEDKFDLIYAFSVFTHLSERAFRVAPAALRNYVRADGLLAITIRPVEYWQFAVYVGSAEAARLEHRHRTNGIAFYPHGDRRWTGT